MVARSALAILLAASALLLAGCSSPPAAPLSNAARMKLYAEYVDGYWAGVAQAYPDAERPPLAVFRVEDPARWTQTITACLADHGVDGATADARTGVGFESTGGITEQQQVGLYTCVVDYPTPGTLESLLSDAQISALYDYYAGFVEPCLLRVGEQPSVPPSRAEFVRTFNSGPRWGPYQDLFEKGMTPAQYTRLTTLCPSEPAWMGTAE